MGLTIHYMLSSSCTSARQVRTIMQRLRRRAVELGFAKVGSLRVFPSRTATGRQRRLPTSDREWYSEKLEVGGRAYEVPPRNLIAFSALPARGSEGANFALVRYPRHLQVAGGKRLATNLVGWQWHDFCKTQFASNPRFGGVESFLRAHLSLVALLDDAITLGLNVDVYDDGKYSNDRDAARLAAEVNSWNEMLAGFGGKLKDSAPAS
jgi:hypothetical protein